MDGCAWLCNPRCSGGGELMHVVCHLRATRGKRPMREIEKLAGIHRGTLSMIERGKLLPTEEQIEALERAYGVPLHEMYPAFVLAAVQREAEDEAA
jgi:transcriptional regulator with XRE-family HTH domain